MAVGNISIQQRGTESRESARPSSRQEVQVRQRESPPVEIGERPVEYSTRETPSQPAEQSYRPSDGGGFLEQTVSRDVGSLSSRMGEQAKRQEQRVAQPRQGRFSEAAGMAPQVPQASQAAPRIPVVDMPAVGSMPAESARPTDTYLGDKGTTLDIHEGLAESGSELAVARIKSRGAASAPIPSARAMEAQERRGVMNAKREGWQRQTTPPAERQQGTNDVTDRPDSIWNRTFGWVNKSRQARTRQASTKRAPGIAKAYKKRFAAQFKNEGVGYRIYAKMLGLSTELDLRDVGVGVREIMAAMDQDATMIDRLFAVYEDGLDTVASWSTREIIDFIESHEIYVGTFKPPNNRGQDVQRRRLRVLTRQQRGIYLHPTMAAMYTADFDGDDMEVSFDPKVAEMTRDPMDYMIGIDGKESINMDFFTVVNIRDGYMEGKSARDYVREVMLGDFANIDARPLVDAVMELSEKHLDDDDAKAAAYGKVFMAARQVADSATQGKQQSDALMSRLCKAVYDGMQSISRQNAYRTFDADVSATVMPTPRTYEDQAIYKVVDGIVDGDGQAPNNFQELRVALNGYLGNVEKKNAPFRFTADVGKMMKMDPRLRVGNEFVIDQTDADQMKSFFESTMKFSESRRMAKEIKKLGRSEYYTQIMRENVLNEVGFPDSRTSDGTPRYARYSDFLKAFCRSYHRHSSMINEANLVFLSNMGIASDSNRTLVSPINATGRAGDARYTTLGDLAEPIRSIYGTYSVERMFDKLSTPGKMGENSRAVMGDYVDPLWAGNPNVSPDVKPERIHTVEREYDRSSDGLWITGKYLTRSLNEFMHENRLIRKDSAIETKRSTRLSALDRMDDVDAQFYMLLVLADKRTGTASKFNTKMYGMTDKGHAKGEGTTVQMMADLMAELRRLDTDGTVSGRRDQMLWVDDVVEAMVMSGPDMFMHFDMDNTAGFLNSEYAKAMMRHVDDVEVLGGIRTAMVFDYRMERVDALISELPDPNGDIDRYKQAWDNLELAKDELSAASEVWHGIIREFEAEATPWEESAFGMLASGKLMRQTSHMGVEYDWKLEHYDAADFWRNPGDHTTLRSVIEDLDLDRNTKWNVIADVVRYWEQDVGLKSWEVGFQLEIGNDSTYSLNSGARQAPLKTHREFEQAFNKWGKRSQKNVQGEIDDAFKRHGDKPGRLMRTLEQLDAQPWALVAIDDDMYADSLMSVKDKTYAQTEKASQHPWTNAIYAALSFQRNGGYMNDVTRTDDRLLGLTAIENMGIQEVVHILADPKAEMWVYNQYGEIGMVTRDLLLESALGRDMSQGVTEADIWEFLQQEPRIASMIRRHNACVMADTDGSGYIGANTTIAEAIGRSYNSADPIGHVKYLMRDHPIYAGIISMASRSLVSRSRGRVGSVTRNERSRVREIESYLCDQIYSYASANVTSSVAARDILDDMGITEDSLKNALRSNYDTFLDQMGLVRTASSESDEDASETYGTALKALTGYIEDVKREVPLGMTIQPVERPRVMGVDVVSAASFWDVIQELSGAKTSVSTGVEGKETYQYAQWASHIAARDGYADLEAVPEEDIDQSWNGMWTNLVDESGMPVLLEVDENGSLVTDIYALKKSNGLDEIVVKAPEGYLVKDRSTDTHGDPISSLFAYMVSKRSNGAEAFNLKAKKAGIDGKDSITKMQGKHRKVTDQETGETYLANYFDIQYELQQLAQQNGENGLMAAKARLAQMMLEENVELGYDDLTLANYMCIADLMLIVGDDGNVHLRSLEMLMSAMKYRLGSSVDEMSDKQIFEAVDQILHDTSETGVGIAQMSSVETFDQIRPYSKASSTSGIRLNSSVFQRNYDLLSAIGEDAMRDGVGPISPSRATEFNRRYADKKHGVPGIKELISEMSVTRNYNVVGYAAASDGSEEINWTIGPSNVIAIGGGRIDDRRVAEICEMAYELGMTVVVDRANLDKVPKDLFFDAMRCNDAGDALIPCFDMRLNGSESRPNNGGRFAIHQVPYSKYVVSVEDSTNEFDLGDAEAKATRAFTDRIKVIESGSRKVTAEELFPNVFRNRDYADHHSFSVSFASGEEIRNLIAQGVRCTIDYGVVEGGHGFDQRRHDVDAAIERYRARFSEANADGMMMGVNELVKCEPGDIVAFAELEITDNLTGDRSYVLAPIIPFPLHGPTKGIPESFTVQNIGTVDNDNTIFAIDWENTSDVSNGFAKYFDSSGGANKGMISFSDSLEEQRLLADGTNVDVYIAKQSTDSRKIGTDRRIKTMISLMALARMHGYNFARDCEGAFPSDPEHPENDDIRERLVSSRIPRAEWANWLRDGDMLFTLDERLNAFLNYECRKILKDGGNPSDYLANVHMDESGMERNTHVMWEFEAMFEQGINYEDSLLRFLHSMDPTFCPDGIDDMSEEYTFRLYRDETGSAEGYDRGVLQMRVPHRRANGQMSYDVWDNVYIGLSFFGEDYSGFSRPNVDGASNFLDAMNTMSMQGARLDEKSAKIRAMWATSDIGRIPRDGGAIGKIDGTANRGVRGES